MARLRRTSQVLETARQRLAGLKSINPAPDLGSALSLANYETMTTDFGSKLDTYNQQVAVLDHMQIGVVADEGSLREMNQRILAAIQAQYGPDSSQYEAAGGTRASERKKKGPKSKQPDRASSPNTP
jgi:hypothetical protein